MTKQPVNFHKHLKAPRTFRLPVVPLIDVLFQLAVFLVFSSSFAAPLPIDVRLPKAVTSDVINNDNICVIISGENIFYLNDKVVTLAELKDFLAVPQNQRRPLLIKVDRRASVGRIVDIWDLGRSLGFGRINVAADQGE